MEDSDLEKLTLSELFEKIAKEYTVPVQKVQDVYFKSHVSWVDPEEGFNSLQTNAGKASYIKFWLDLSKNKRQDEDDTK